MNAGGTEPVAVRASERLRRDDMLLLEMGGERLRMALDRFLWEDRDHVSFGELAEWFPRLLYLPRVVSRATLMVAVQDGVAQTDIRDTFATAAAWDEQAGRYRGLRLHGTPSVVDASTLVIKPDVAAAFKQREDAERDASRQGTSAGGGSTEGVAPVGGHGSTQGGSGTGGEVRPKVGGGAPRMTTFVASVRLDPHCIGRDAGRIAEEVVQHFSTLPSAEVEVLLEVQIRVPDGIDEATVRTVSENCNTLGFRSHHFERE